MDSTTEALSSLGATFDLIYFWIKGFDNKYQAWSNMYIEAMKYLFKKIPVQLHKQLSHKEKYQQLLYILEVISTWKKLEASTTKETKTENKIEIKINLQMANQSWNEWDF